MKIGEIHRRFAKVISEEPESVIIKVAEPSPKSKPVKVANISENDDCIIDIGNDYIRLKEEFNALKVTKI